MGRRPGDPEKQRRLGNPGKRKPRARLAPAVLAAPDSGIAPPAFLATQEDACRVWHWLIGELSARSWLAAIDHAALGRYCQNLAFWTIARDDLATNGLTRLTPMTNGEAQMLRRNPSFETFMRLDSAMAEFENSAGMRPLARLRMQAILAQPGAARDPLTPTPRDELPLDGEAAPAGEWNPVGVLNADTKH